MYFSKAGAVNTGKALEIAFREAKDRGICHVVIATTRGATAARAARMAKECGIRLVVVTHNTGFKKPGQQQLEDRYLKELREAGARVVTGTLPTRGLGRSVKEKWGSIRLK